MKRHVIIGRFGVEDKLQIQKGSDEIFTQLNFIKSNKRLDFGIGQAIEDLKDINVYPSEICLDLLILAAHVYAADTRISRRTESQDTWTREIRLVVPVSQPERWNPTIPILVRMLNFLTGDRWIIGFRPRPKQYSAILPSSSNQLLKASFDNVALFSGGLDSLIGAINMLENGGTALLVSHAGEGSVSEAQSNLYNELKEKYKKTTLERLRLWMVFPKGLIKKSGPEDTTRSRSFLFFATGIFAASGLDEPFKLLVPENGLIALNVPLDPLRLGSLSTRTTHPFYIARWNELLAKLGIDGNVENPYWNKTKGEMVTECANLKLLRRLVTDSFSCSSPKKGRWQGYGTQHCGYCLPCIIRRAALTIGLGSGEDKTKYTVSNLEKMILNTRLSVGKQARSFQYAFERLQKEPESAKLLIHKPGPLSDDPTRWEELADVYLRGLNEVAALLSNVTTCPR